MALTKFPFETDKPKIEVTLPVGEHILELVVVDSAGLQSAPDQVVIEVRKEALAPRIIAINPNSGVQGSTITAVVISGNNFTGATEVKFQGQGVNVEIVNVSDEKISVNITIAANAALGPRRFSVTNPVGTAQSPANVVFRVEGQPRPVTPEPRPVTPEPRPVTPEPRPVTPEPRPVTPEPRPVTPEPRPVTPEPRPITPEPRPVTPEPRPITPEPRPITPEPRPVTPEPRPVTPEPRPITPEPRPITPEPRPITPEPRPITPEPRPVTPEPRPVTPEPRPITPTPQPIPREPAPRKPGKKRRK